MIEARNVSLRFDKRKLFEDVNIKFTPGNCYGVIGANGAGKSTFLKILSGEIEPTEGRVEITPGERLAVLKQDHYAYDPYSVQDTVIMGHERLWQVMQEKDAIYAKGEFSEEEGMRAAELEAEFAEMDGWNAESDAAELLSGLGIHERLHHKPMAELNPTEKVRVLLAQALFGNPDILLLDEPTNDLDFETIQWLEDFLADFKNTVIVVSHDRHFLDSVCTHIADIDYGKISVHTGNYSFWYQASQLALRQRQERNKKVEEKRKQLQEFVERFSANAAKSRQATSRKKMLDKLSVDDIQPSNRRYPAIIFQQERQAGDQILKVENLSKQLEDGRQLFQNVNFSLQKGDKVAFLAKEGLATTHLFEMLMGHETPDTGSVEWGVTIKPSYLPAENSAYFNSSLNLIDWLRQYSEEKDETYIRGFLGKMLFSGEESLKQCHVLSGGEKVRCMLSRMMLTQGNVLLLDEPTNHLDLETIQALNSSLSKFNGQVLMATHDQEFMNTVANRIIELTPGGIIDKLMTYEEYINDPRVAEQRESMYEPA
jgi:ATPase subunit of ABC transporter with duplicated ATPase domains